MPRTNPTTAFWQMPPHPTLSDVQSPALQKTTDVAVIGSGITGCSVVSNLLSLGGASPSASSPSPITVFEARQLTSGATGRNGGLLSNFVPGEFTSLSARFGHEQAVKVARFANRTLEKMHALAGSTDEFQSVSEVRRLLDIILLADEEALDGAKKSLALYEEHVPEDRGKAMFYTPAEAEEVCFVQFQAQFQFVLTLSPIAFQRQSRWRRVDVSQWRILAVPPHHFHLE